MCEGQPSRPANILEIVAINQGRSPLTMDDPTAPALAPEAFKERIEEGHVVVDTRDSAAFGGGHIPGAYNIKGASPEFEQRLGWVVGAEAPVVLVLDDDGAIGATLRKLAFVGLDSRVKGYLAGGMDAWAEAIGAEETLAQISVTELQDKLAAGDDVRVLDVREPDEYEDGHVAGAASMSFKVLEQHLEELPFAPDDRIALVCAGGVRSSTASSILLRNGYRNLLNVTGGMGAWRAADLPTTTD